MSGGKKGKLAAALVFTVLVGIVVYGLMNSGGTNPSVPAQLDGPTPEPRPTGGILGSVQGSVFQSFDPESGELRYELEWETLDPVGQGRYEVTAPIATFYQGDSVIRVEAAEGRLLWPSRDQEPESGNLSGDVVVTVSEDGTEPRLLGTMKTPSLFFQSVLGELNAPEVVRIEAPGIEFEGRGLTARISEVQQRLQYLRVNEHLGTTIRPDLLGRGEGDGAGAQRERRASGSEAGDGAGLTGGAGLIDLYRVAFTRQVELSQGGRSARADEAEVWVRLRDRQLASNAIAPLMIGSTSVERVAGGPTGNGGSGGGASEDEGTDADQLPIRFTNAGSIEIVPLIDVPAQLERDDLAARFRATESSAVVLRDEESGASIRCGSLAWGFTTRRLAVRGVGGLLGVEFEFPGEASVRTGAVDVDLAAGIAAFPGAGRVTMLSGFGGSDEQTTIEWTERADVVLDTSSAASRVSSSPMVRWMTAAGTIDARTPSAQVNGEFLRADFVSRMVDGRPQNDLSRISVQERATAVINDGDVSADIRAARMDVLFDVAGQRTDGRIVPSRASASGDAVALVNGDRLAGQAIDAVLLADADGRTQVQSIDSSGDVTLRTREGLDLAAATLHASERTGTMTLVGYPATVGLYTSADGSGASASEEFAEGFSITGESIRFDREPRLLTVFGGGVLSYAAQNPLAEGYDHGRILWERSMRFDDRAGIAEFAGSVRADAGTMLGDEYSMRGERLTLSLVPDLLDEQARRSLSEGDEVEALVSLRLEAGLDGEARAEGRRYSAGPDAPERMLETAARLSGVEIVAQRDTNRITVPGAGRLVYEDRRERADGSSTEDELPTDARGTTVFDWAGSLDADRTDGRIVMSRDVRMRHRHPGADSLTVVETERLTATVTQPGEQAGSQYELESVEAEGAVLATHRESQVVADRLSYARDASRIIASALPGNRVTFFDARSGRHLPAERVILDLITGRWRIEQAGQVTTPIGSGN